MEQKFFFFDIDNTLAVWPEGKIPDSAQYSLDELKRRGHRVALATGRIQVDAKRFCGTSGAYRFCSRWRT